MNVLKNYAKQQSTWLGLAKIGSAIGLYSTGVAGAISSFIMAAFGIYDVVRNEKTHNDSTQSSSQ